VWLGEQILACEVFSMIGSIGGIAVISFSNPEDSATSEAEAGAEADSE